MKDLEQIFERIQEKKKKQKELKKTIKDAMETALGYKSAVEGLATAREKKKAIELSIKEQFSSELDKIEDFKIDIDSDQQMMSDLALTQLMKGETIELKDKYDVDYEPVFSVKFKKMN